MRKRIKKYLSEVNEIKSGILLIVTILIATTIVGLMMKIPKLPFFGGAEEGWLGYWGGVIGIIGAYAVLRIQLKNDKYQSQIQSIDSTFFQLLDMTNKNFEKREYDLSNLYKEIQKEKKLKDSSLLKRDEVNYQKQIEKELHSLIENLNYESKTSKGFSFQLDILKETSKNANVKEYFRALLFPEQSSESELRNKLRNIFYDTTTYYRQLIFRYPVLISELKDEIENNDKERRDLDYVYSLLDRSRTEVISDLKLVKRVFSDIETVNEGERSFYAVRFDDDFEECLKKLHDVIQKDVFLKFPKTSRPSLNSIEYTEDEKERVIQKAFNSHFPNIRQNFRLFYRVIRYLNENKKLIGEDQWRNYLGFLKAGLEEETLCLIFYNAKYTVSGEKMGIELRKTQFFGDANDFTGDKHSYFSEGILLWPTDLEALKSLTNLENVD
ncbi:hypothetical protein [uncultured Enterococcus sp.]|uniref:hypothetical protein n=1 Tax=uncultured Enterococcus sp. TaxID=167972 RepID=UPI002AA69DA7|nr:hypothetical protein [uncultured Enterococcus sp.]